MISTIRHTFEWICAYTRPFLTAMSGESAETLPVISASGPRGGKGR